MVLLLDLVQFLEIPELETKSDGLQGLQSPVQCCRTPREAWSVAKPAAEFLVLNCTILTAFRKYTKSNATPELCKFTCMFGVA